MITTKQAVKELGVSVVTLRKLRRMGMPYIKISRRIVRYEMDKIQAWVDSNYSMNKKTKSAKKK